MGSPVILIDTGYSELSNSLTRFLSSHGFMVIEAPDKTDIIHFFQINKPDLVIIGSSLKSNRIGLENAKRLRQWDLEIPVIFVVEKSSESQVLAALRAGVNDYFKLPFSNDLIIAINNLLPEYKKETSRPSSVISMIGSSKPMLEIKDYLEKVAKTDSSVLITGETGTGKELAASFIHHNSARCDKPFLCINCGALPENLIESELFGYERGAFTGAVISKKGKFRLAEGGTVFLDEVGDMNMLAQSKLLRSIETNEIFPLGGTKPISVDLRYIFATNQDLESLVIENRFREDLYYRLNIGRVQLPPLRERREDILLLLEHFIMEMNYRFQRKVKGFKDEALKVLIDHSWPGNIRELKNLVEASFINLPPEKVTSMDLPKPIYRRLKETQGLPKSERDWLLSALFDTKWNKTEAARNLNISRMTLYRLMKKNNIDPNYSSQKL